MGNEINPKNFFPKNLPTCYCPMSTEMPRTQNTGSRAFDTPGERCQIYLPSITRYFLKKKFISPAMFEKSSHRMSLQALDWRSQFEKQIQGHEINILLCSLQNFLALSHSYYKILFTNQHMLCLCSF